MRERLRDRPTSLTTRFRSGDEPSHPDLSALASRFVISQAVPNVATRRYDHARTILALGHVKVNGHEEATLRHVSRVVRHFTLKLSDEMDNRATALGRRRWRLVGVMPTLLSRSVRVHRRQG